MTLQWNGDELAKEIQMATAEGCLNLAEVILGDAVVKCPRLSGTLRNSGTISVDKDVNSQETYQKAKSGKVDSAKSSDLKPNITDIYISFNTPYAHRRHEDLQAVNYTEAGTGAKFLEKAWNENINDAEKYITLEGKKRGLI